jgi:hypothetical protein
MSLVEGPHGQLLGSRLPSHFIFCNELCWLALKVATQSGFCNADGQRWCYLFNFNLLSNFHLVAWCSGITSASHAEGPGLNPQCVHCAQSIEVKAIPIECLDLCLTLRFRSGCLRKQHCQLRPTGAADCKSAGPCGRVGSFFPSFPPSLSALFIFVLSSPRSLLPK